MSVMEHVVVVPVMILGVTILRKKYPLAKYLCVLLIVTGVALFLYKPNKSSAVADDHVFGFGEILLVRSRLHLHSPHSGPSAAPPSLYVSMVTVASP